MNGLSSDVKRRGLELDLHAFAGGSDFGIVVARFFDDVVDALIRVIGIVVEEDQFLGSTLHNDVDGFAPVAVSPAAFLGFVLFGQILGVVNQ
jgi:hypothetical protein